MADLKRQLAIKVGVCRRLLKEVLAYENEAKTNEARVQKMRDDGKDEYDIRKQEEVLQESYMMIPDSKARLQTSLSELKTFLEQHAEEDLPGADDKGMVEARNILMQAAAT
ncbi:unnamed protein product [Phaeothamnion confervicola]